jgi:SAM-dependent methyltransferase
VVQSSFEDFVLPDGGFDLGVSATAFHWLDEETALAKVADLLKPGGWWVMFWNVFGDPGRADPFHEATKLLLEGPIGPSREDLKIPYALDRDARMAALEKTSAFDSLEYRSSPWSLVLDADQTVSLYATYSNVNIRPDREAVLEELGRIARGQFQGRVVRNMVTSLYMARRI